MTPGKPKHSDRFGTVTKHMSVNTGYQLGSCLIVSSDSKPPLTLVCDSVQDSGKRRTRIVSVESYFSLAYSAFACFRIGISGSASCHNDRKS